MIQKTPSHTTREILSEIIIVAVILNLNAGSWIFQWFHCIIKKLI